MARSLALGIGEPAAFSDGGSGRAEELAALTDGTAAPSAEVAAAADLLFLCHKPKQLEEVSAQIGGFDGSLVSVLAATPLADLRAAYPKARVVRTMPNIPVEIGEGVVALAAESDQVPELDRLLARLGLVVRVPERDFELVTAIGGCAPAFFALFAQELIAAAVERGLDRELAADVVNQTLRGTSGTLRANQVDTAALIAAVASPGGLTERAIESFTDSELGAAVRRAVATVLGQ